MTTDNPTVEDLFFAVDLERLGCDLLAEEVRCAETHDDVACLTMGLRQLLEQGSASPKALAELLAVVKAADEAFLEEDRRQQAQRDAAARAVGDQARAAGLIRAEDLELLERLRDDPHPEARNLVDELEVCQSQEDVDKLKSWWRQMGAEL